MSRSAKKKEPRPEKPNGSNTIKDPDEWTTGEEPMTVAFDLACQRLTLVGTDREQPIQPDINDGFRELFKRETDAYDEILETGNSPRAKEQPTP
jgi:hypothetical protein